MTVIPDRLDLLDGLHLSTGSHPAPTGNKPEQACVMEVVSWLAGEPWTDSPQCASPVVAAFLRSWQDALPDEPRQAVLKYAPRLVGSAGTAEQENDRAWMATDWLVRVHTPAWLRLAGINAQAENLEALPELRAGVDVPSMLPAIRTARSDAAAASDAARTAAWDAARTAARSAASDAARAAAWDAASAAASDAAWDAARTAARSAAWDAASDAARAAASAAASAAARTAAWDAARTAARSAASDAARAAAWDAASAAASDAAWDAARTAARSAAWDAASAAVAPTRDALIESAHDLVDRMLAVTEVAS